MSDKKLMEKWSKINDPREMLKAIVKHETFLGFDPYYRDLREELLANAERLSRKPKVTK